MEEEAAEELTRRHLVPGEVEAEAEVEEVAVEAAREMHLRIRFLACFALLESFVLQQESTSKVVAIVRMVEVVKNRNQDILNDRKFS